MGKGASMASPITAGLGAGFSIYNAISEGKKKRSAQRALEGLTAPPVTNVAENLQVSTRGADLRTQEAGRNTASSVDALRSGGARALIGGIGNVQANNNAVTAEIGANLDEQQKDIDRMKAEDERRIQGVNEQRYQSDVAGLSSQIDSANDAKNQSIANAYQGISDMANSYDVARDKSKGRTTTPTTTVNGSTNQFDTPANRRLVQKTVKKGIRG